MNTHKVPISRQATYPHKSDHRLGIAVSSTGRMFSNYARSLDPNNIAYTVAELTANNTETPYPSAAINSPPGVRTHQIHHFVFAPDPKPSDESEEL